MTNETKRKDYVEGCNYCEEHKNDYMFPPHDASPTCKSGNRDHCTCDTCF